MPGGLRFVVPLVAALALLSIGAALVVNATSRRWFEKDVRLRAELAVGGARHGLVHDWRAGDDAGIGHVLAEITRDERIMSAAACSAESVTLAQTTDFPSGFGCGRFGERLRATWQTLDEPANLAGGDVLLSAIPVLDEGKPLGFVVLVHDMSYAERREALSRRFTLIAFVVLALVTSAVTLLVARSSWRRWTAEVRRLLRGGGQRPEFHPLLGDVRDLIARISSEAEGTQGPWNAGRLKATLQRHLHGEKVVIVANREPYVHERAPDGGVRILHPASGLVTALEPVMRACSGVWVAHGSGSADRATADRNGRLWVPPGEHGYQIRRVWLTDEEERGYYYGLANEGLWPLCHLAHTRPQFRSDDWAHYRRVNQRFADAACAEAGGDDPLLLVQDYHLALAPRMIRERLPRATILTFWHIPWPNAERFGICPWQEELLDGLLGSSIIGFHTQAHCNNFLDTVDRTLEARIDREQHGVVQGKRTTLVRPYPISIEWPIRWLDGCPSTEQCRAAVLDELGLGPDALLGVGVDRLDYTKGIEERLLAVERLLARFPHLRGRFTFVQLAAPSRTAIERYRELNASVEGVVDRINRRFGSGGYRPVILMRAHHEPPTVFRYYRAADLCYVSSLHDGMNLVAKEFVAARDDERGVLVLSHFTGAARELTEALVVNPYDLDQAASALATALAMPAAEQAARMHAMRSLLAHFNVYRWAGRMLIDAAQLRERERLTGRLADRIGLVEGAGG